MTVDPPTVERAPLRAAPPLSCGRQRVRQAWVADAFLVAVGLGLGASIALPISEATRSSLSSPGGVTTVAGDITAMAGTYLLLIMVLLAARLPGVERAVGQDRLLRWHRCLSSAPLLLIGAHAILTTLGYAEAGHLGFWSETGSLLVTIRWIFAALVSYLMLVVIAGMSIRAVRRRVNYDTWWVIHLYTYLALALSVPHQIFDGTNFVDHPLVQSLWLVLWFATVGMVILYRIGLPIARSLYHRLEIAEVRPEAAGVYSLLVRGRHLERLKVEGGQYFAWRFCVRGLWWHAHPFSLSGMPIPPYMRATIKVAGDTTAIIPRLRPGTRIAIEGPYGNFTDAVRSQRKVALIGAGVGITPLRALLEDIPGGVDIVVVQRASRSQDMIHASELEPMVASRNGRFVKLVGPRDRHPLADPGYLRQVVPDIVKRDIYVCGPQSFTARVAAAAAYLGVPDECIHCEAFEF